MSGSTLTREEFVWYLYGRLDEIAPTDLMPEMLEGFLEAMEEQSPNEIRTTLSQWWPEKFKSPTP